MSRDAISSIYFPTLHLVPSIFKPLSAPHEPALAYHNAVDRGAFLLRHSQIESGATLARTGETFGIR